MDQSLTHLLVHAIFSTKDRRPFLRSEEIRNEIYAYMAGALKNLDCHQSNVESVTAYIVSQAEHHKKFSYQEEIREIFKTPQGRLRRTLCLGLKHQCVGRPFRVRRLMPLHPGLKHPTSQSLGRGWLFGVTYHNMRGAIA